ncbi:MAG: hypothetical protein CAPSK01_004003 [Candidatus Accumulibacter vicinus]|uniref:Uncharacterized protein n=1 Tax=Candidatus Accumulibacter vicinus TaxID=2954382 RepID=A0A084XVZ4_9PROT|nr:MAG: hypothetical protein CAPSK01_004003 [Candidatus Accumulibacter vicinus]
MGNGRFHHRHFVLPEGANIQPGALRAGFRQARQAHSPQAIGGIVLQQARTDQQRIGGGGAKLVGFIQTECDRAHSATDAGRIAALSSRQRAGRGRAECVQELLAGGFDSGSVRHQAIRQRGKRFALFGVNLEERGNHGANFGAAGAIFGDRFSGGSGFNRGDVRGFSGDSGGFIHGDFLRKV